MKQSTRVTSLVLALTLALTFSAQPALAHYMYAYGEVDRVGDICIFGRAETSHGSQGYGYFKVDTQTYQHLNSMIGTLHCYQSYGNPAGYLAVGGNFWKWTGSQWALCYSTGWNQTTQNGVYHIQRSVNFVGGTYCGNGYYATTGYHWKRVGSNWHGGTLWSGYHYLPA